MSIRVLMISMLGLAGLVVPARASYTFYTDAPTFNAGASGQGLTMSAVLDFTNPLIGTPANSEYADLTTGVDFFGYNSSESGRQAMALVGATLRNGATVTANANSMEIVLPSSIFALGFTMSSTTATSFSNFCIDAASPTSCDQSVFLNPSTSAQFFGITSTTAFSTIWITASGGSPELVLQNFDVGGSAGTPELASIIGMATGLILLGVFRRQLQRFAL